MTKEFKEKITENLNTVINASAKSKTRIAVETELSQAAISNLLSGESLPSLETLKKLCQVLGCNYDDVLGKL